MLVAARHKANLAQEELARRLGRPQSFVAKYEQQERRLDVVELIQIAKILNADPFRPLGAIGGTSTFRPEQQLSTNQEITRKIEDGNRRKANKENGKS
jgi:transcriptional regulator with XRE-family HTH domain